MALCISCNKFHYCCWEIISQIWLCIHQSFNTLRPRQNCRHFPNNIFKCIFMNENVWISLNISLKFVPKVWINNIPLSKPVMVILLMLTWPPRQWVTPFTMRTMRLKDWWIPTPHIEGILPKGPYPPCLRMADRALLAGYPPYYGVLWILLLWCQ